ncbi:TerB family tellurite resistance protein, partial [Corallococcus praedator]
PGERPAPETPLDASPPGRSAWTTLEDATRMVTPSNPDSHFHIEVIKLLLQVATSDDRVTREEIEQIIDTARGFSVPLSELTALTQCLQEGKPLPPPNVTVLRENPTAVLEAVHALIARDGHIHEAEIEMTRQIRAMLGVTP